jgi:PPM family protein phosphatase
MMPLSQAAITHTGVVRANNEDAFCCGHIAKLGVQWMLLADGMGGHNAGEVASEMLCQHFEQQLNILQSVPSQGWPQWADEQFNLASKAIFANAQQNSSRSGMGTTGVLALIEEDTADNQESQRQCHIAWVGDSRAYAWLDGMLMALTEDHSMIQHLLNKGAITKAEAARSNTKHLLSRALGVKPAVEVDKVSHKITNEMAFVLTTDGIHDYLTETDLCQSLQSLDLAVKQCEQAIKSLCEDIIECAISAGSRDNLTVGITQATK